MSAKKPACAPRTRKTGLEFVSSPAHDSPDSALFPAPHSTGVLAARRHVNEMVELGATFTLLRREGRADSFTYRLTPGADHTRCRRIIADVKDAGAFAVFVAAIAELEGAPS